MTKEIIGGVKKVVLCNGIDCACPEVTIDDSNDLVTIKDDFGSSIKMSVSQFKELKNYFDSSEK